MIASKSIVIAGGSPTEDPEQAESLERTVLGMLGSLQVVEGGAGTVTTFELRLQNPSGEAIEDLRKRGDAYAQIYFFNEGAERLFRSQCRRLELAAVWSQPEPTDADRVAEAYLKSMSPKVSLKDKAWFKVARISGMSLAGSALGALAGPAGGVAGFVLGAAVGTAVSLSDGFLIERLLQNRSPRRFATEVLGPILATESKQKPSDAT
jgi:hypothetical protein